VSQVHAIHRARPRVKRVVLACLLALAGDARAQGTVVGSKHDLSIGGTRPEICVFCHTPHGASIDIAAPLWNRTVSPGITFTPYTSATLDSQCPATPSGVSLACLSCHDGAISNPGRHKLINPPGSLSPDDAYAGSCSRCHTRGQLGPMLTPGLSVPGTNLRNDHPISMPFPTTAQDPAFNLPPDAVRGWPDLRLYDGKVECPTCHNPHDPSQGMFLRKSNAADALCLSCHIK